MGQESSTTTTTAGINVFLSTKAENMNIVVYSLYVLHFASFKPLNTQQILTGRYIYGVSLIYFSFNVNLAWLYLYQFLQEFPYAQAPSCQTRYGELSQVDSGPTDVAVRRA